MPPGPVAKKFECITQISMNIFATEIIIYNKINLVLFSAALVDLAKSTPSHLVFPLYGAPVAQWVKCWPTDLVVPCSSPTRDEIFSTVNRVPVHRAFQYHLPIILI